MNAPSDNPVLVAALDYAARGWPVFPCSPTDKTPMVKRGFHDASTDPGQIRAWWRRSPSALIGIPTGPETGFVVDLDIGDAITGAEYLSKFEAYVGELPCTAIAETGSGGYHLWWAWDPEHPVTNGTNVLPALNLPNGGGKAAQVDVRGAGGYVIVPPSVRTDGGAYSWCPGPEEGLARAPERVLAVALGTEKAAPPPPSKGGPTPAGSVSDDAALRRYARAALDSEVAAVAAAPSGGRNERLNRAAFSLGGFVAVGALSEAEVRAALEEACRRNGLARDDGLPSVRKTIDSGLRKGIANPRDLSEIGTRKERPGGKEDPPETDSGEGAAPAGGAAAADPLGRLNRKFCVVLDGSKTRVLTFEPYTDAGQTRLIPRFLSFEDFHNFYCNETVRVGDKNIPLGSWWSKHRERRQYDGLVFRPGAGQEVNGRLNLWRGWGIEPKPGDWTLMRRHIDEVLAAGNPEAANYLIHWVAWAFQNPAERAQAAPVLRGKKGSGKGTLGNALRRIFGQHGVHISDAEHLAGRFNGHLRDAIFLFADEAYWPGNKSAEGSLKRLITEPDLFIEAKGRDGTSVSNMLHVMMASDEQWVVPAGEAERRFAVFEVSDHRLQDPAWFGPLYEEMDRGGLAAMLYDLLRMDLGGWHPREIPKTDGLVAQQARSLSAEDEWWVGMLQEGTIPCSDPNNPERAVSGEYVTRVDPFSGTRETKHLGLFESARRSVPRLKGRSDTALGHYLTEQDCKRMRVLRRRGWEFPPLKAAREAWERRFPGWTWPDETQADWEPDDA